MNILQIHSHDSFGGAAQIARQLLHAYRALGHRSELAVGYRALRHPDILELDRSMPDGPWSRILQRSERLLQRHPFVGSSFLRGKLQVLNELDRWWDRKLGREVFGYPAIRRLLQEDRRWPQILHLHNAHGDYLDLPRLLTFSREIPTVWTLHDQWAFTGHCAYSIDCERWVRGCGSCPDLNIYPAIERDRSAANAKKKRLLFARARLHVATPSRWLLEQLSRSPIAPHIAEVRHIPNGVDLTVFRPREVAEARYALGLPQEAEVVLFAGHAAASSPFKDFGTIREALVRYARQHPDRSRKLILLCLGEISEPIDLGPRAEIRFVKYSEDPRRVALHYQACDLYVHAARGENFPNVILEAMACGRPVVATDVGGIREQLVSSGAMTGRLVPPRGAEAMADAIASILRSPTLHRTMGINARTRAETEFSLDRQAAAYLSWFRELQ